MADAAEQRARARIGTVIRGKYRIESLLATGSMACVYSATHRNASRVALKVLHPHLARDPAMRERFRREGYFANTIEHPGVPRAIDDDDTEDGCAFIVMELLEGETLEQRRLRMGGKLPLTFVLTVADSVLEVLAAAHEKKILHRDLKPDNVFITFAGEVKLLDFGVARWDDGKSSSDMTAAGMVVGTPAYMPPEQALGRRESVDAQSDIWAVGATLFVVITGQTVHTGGDAKARLIATARQAARKLQEVAPYVPRGVAAVVDRALAFEKRDRWPDALAMREALRWARRSLDAFALDSSNEGELHRRPSLYPGPPSTTRGGYHEEVTRRGFSPTDEASEEDEPTLARAYSEEERDVITSAPSITREVPASAEIASGPTTSGPVFSLRRGKGEEDSDPEIGATTEPQLRAANVSEPDALASMPLEPPMTAAEETRPLLLQRVRSEATRTVPMGTPVVRPAAGAPARSPSDAPAPHTVVMPHVAASGSARPPAAAAPGPTMKSASVPPEMARALASSPPQASSSPPPGFGSTPPLASSAPSGLATTQTPQEPPAPNSVAPGPVLKGLVEPSRGSTARAAGTIAIGLAVLAAGTVVVVRQQRGPAQGAAVVETPRPTEAPSAASATPSASVAAIPSAAAAASSTVTEPPPAPVAAVTVASATVAPTHAPAPRPRPTPRRAAPPPSASATSAPTSTAEPASTEPSGSSGSSGSSSGGAATPPTSDAPKTETPKTETPKAEAPAAPKPETPAAPVPKPVPTEDPTLPRAD